MKSYELLEKIKPNSTVMLRPEQARAIYEKLVQLEETQRLDYEDFVSKGRY